MRHPNASILSPDGAPPNFTMNSNPSFKCHTLSLNVSTHTIDHVYFYDNYVYHVLFQYFVNKIEHFLLIHLQMYLIWRQESGCSQMETCVFTATCIWWKTIIENIHERCITFCKSLSLSLSLSLSHTHTHTHTPIYNDMINSVVQQFKAMIL